MNARRYGRPLTHALAALACTLLVPSAALAATGTSGGGGLGGTGTTGTGAPTTGTGTTGTGTTGTTPTTPVVTTIGSAPVSVSSDGITLQTTSSALLRHALSFTGTAPGAAGRTVEIEREGQATRDQWVPTVEATVSSTGAFAASWPTTQVGRFAMRAMLVTNGASAAPATVPQSFTISVFRGARATIYGPGFYGRHTACGARLSRTSVGVANRTLPCGTKVSILFHGRELTVPVIDRGPYANGADWDLTTATAAALGMTGTSTIGTIATRGATATTATPAALALSAGSR